MSNDWFGPSHPRFFLFCFRRWLPLSHITCLGSVVLLTLFHLLGRRPLFVSLPVAFHYSSIHRLSSQIFPSFLFLFSSYSPLSQSPSGDIFDSLSASSRSPNLRFCNVSSKYSLFIFFILQFLIFPRFRSHFLLLYAPTLLYSRPSPLIHQFFTISTSAMVFISFLFHASYITVFVVQNMSSFIYCLPWMFLFSLTSSFLFLCVWSTCSSVHRYVVFSWFACFALQRNKSILQSEILLWCNCHFCSISQAVCAFLQGCSAMVIQIAWWLRWKRFNCGVPVDL